jgi:hypothetical protein
VFEEQVAAATKDLLSEPRITYALSPYTQADYDKIEWKYRTTDQYGTDGYQWFETFWQRQYLSQLEEWTNLHNDVDAAGEMPYPGKDNLIGGTALTTYQEANVYPDGTPKPRDQQSMTGGVFTQVPLSTQKFHPDV